jgi:hypothetical protein
MRVIGQNYPSFREKYLPGKVQSTQYQACVFFCSWEGEIIHR